MTLLALSTAAWLCACPPPPAMVNGPFRGPSYVSLFNLLVDHAWKTAELRTGPDLSEKRKAIVIGRSQEVERQLIDEGWRILERPWKPMSAVMLLHLPILRGNPAGLARAIDDLSVWIVPGGFFAIARIELEDCLPNHSVDDMMDLLLWKFKPSPFDTNIAGWKFRVWQKRWMKQSA